MPAGREARRRGVSAEAARTQDTRFRDAVAAIDAGDVAALKRLLRDDPDLVRERLTAAGPWLRDKIGDALEGYFHRPFLLWFVADNPIRRGRMPGNIDQITRTLIDAAQRARSETLQEQLDYALGLVVTGRIAQESGRQIALMDALIDGGAMPGAGYGALGAGNFEAAAHMIARGGETTLAAALCLGRGSDAERLLRTATADDRQIALVAAAINGQAQALAKLIAAGVDIDAYGTVIHPHATALHQAVFSGSLDAVQTLVQAGARLDIRDKIYDGTPLQWAEHDRDERANAIADYLRARQAGIRDP